MQSHPSRTINWSATLNFSFPIDACVCSFFLFILERCLRRSQDGSHFEKIIPHLLRGTPQHARAGFRFASIHTYCESLTSLLRTLDYIVTIPFNPLEHRDAEVTRAYFCQFTCRSKISAYRHERIDPLWPKPVVRGKPIFYRAIDCKRYLDSANSRTLSESPKRKPESF
jgi:hypothetical protein